MADKSYNIDDILNEYAKPDYVRKSNDSDISLDDLLGDYSTSSSADTLSEQLDDIRGTLKSDELTENYRDDYHNNDSNINSEILESTPVLNEKPVKEKAHTKKSTAKKNKADGDPFEEKYKNLTMVSTKERPSDETFSNVKKEKKPTKSSRSFSDKFEMDNAYDDNNDIEKKSVELSSRSKNSQKNAPDTKNAPDNKKYISNDPFDKYSAISSERNVDDILAEYNSVSEKKHTQAKTQLTQHKNFTDFFTKIISKGNDNSDDEQVSGNTELLDGMMRMKKERQSRTASISPIERKSINDIELNLDDKIIPNTSQIPINEDMSEIEKITALKERRNKKIKDFVLVGDEEETEEDELNDENHVKIIDDFESFEDAPSIANDISQLKSSLVMRLLVLGVCLCVSLYIALANDSKALPIIELLNKRTQTNVFLFVNTVIGLLAAFTSYTVISCGLSKLISLKADCDTLCAVTTVTSIAMSMVMFANTNLIRGSFVHIYIPVAIISLLFNTVGKLLIVSRTQRSFNFVSGASEKFAVFEIQDEEQAQSFTKGTLKDFPSLASMRKTEFLSEFLKTSYSSDATDRFCNIFSPIVIGVSILAGILAGILSNSEHNGAGIYIGMSVFNACVALCSGFSIMLIVNMPMAAASKKYAENQGVILGYEAIDEFAEANSLLIDAKELFPQGSVNLSAIKVFSDTRIDEAIVEAASLTNQADSILKNMFYDIIAGKTELLNPVESYIFEDSMGLCGWINNKRVLLGNRDLMINHSIEGMPAEAKEKEYTSNGRSAIYLSISGELSAMFVVELTPSLEVKNALKNLQKNDIYTIIRSVDSVITINKLSDMFDISPELFKLIPFRIHPEFESVTSYQPRQKATLACSGRFSVFSSLVLSCKRIKSTIGVGLGLQALSMILGVLICVAMVVLKSYDGLSVSMITGYCGIFTVALLVYQGFRKL